MPTPKTEAARPSKPSVRLAAFIEPARTKKTNKPINILLPNKSILIPKKSVEVRLRTKVKKMVKRICKKIFSFGFKPSLRFFTFFKKSSKKPMNPAKNNTAKILIAIDQLTLLTEKREKSSKDIRVIGIVIKKAIPPAVGVADFFK